jgi:5-methylthioribose kinase
LRKVIDLFSVKFLKTWREGVKEDVAKVDGFDNWYLKTVLCDTVAVTGLELCRRIVGMAHVKDITSIDDDCRLRVERICITIAKTYIKNRESYIYGKNFIQTIKNVENEFPK